MKKFSRKIKKGFTLVELVVVIAIIAILSAASVATYFGVTTSARKTTGKSEAQQIMDVIRVAALDESDNTVSAKVNDQGEYYLSFESSEEIDVLVDLLGKNGITVNADNKAPTIEALNSSDEDKTLTGLKYSTNYYSYDIHFSNFTVDEAVAVTSK